MNIICDGHEVELIRLGEPIVAPDTCPFCGKPVVLEGAHTKCVNSECLGRGFQKVMQWVVKRDIKGLGDVTLGNLYDLGYVRTPADLYNLDYLVLEDLVGEKTSDKLIEALQKSKHCLLSELMGSVCIRFLGRRECEIIQEKTGISTVNGWFNLTVKDLLSVGGYQERKATEIVEGIYQTKGLIMALLKAGVVPYIEEAAAPAPSQTGLPLSGQILLFTGRIDRCDASGVRFTRKRMQQLAKDEGAQVVDDFDSSVTMLVTAELNSTSSKMKKAQKSGTKIVSEDDFFTMIGI